MWTEVSPGSVSEKEIYGDECLLGNSGVSFRGVCGIKEFRGCSQDSSTDKDVCDCDEVRCPVLL